MKKISLFLIALILLIAPATAETLTFEDTARFDYYAICADPTDYRPEGYIYGFDYLDPTDENYIPNADYDTFLTSDDDRYDYIDFEFKPEQSFDLPVTLWYEDGQRDLTISVNFTQDTSWVFFFTESMTVTVTDSNSNVLVSSTYTNILDEYVRVTLDEDSISISRTDRSVLSRFVPDSSVGMTLSPLTATTFDLTTLTNVSSYTVVKVIDDGTFTEQGSLPGWIQWMYNRIAFMDVDKVLYNALVYVVFMWDILMFITTFMLFSTWSYFILANVVGLIYGIFQTKYGTLAMIEGYFKGLYYSFLLPIHIFKFLINLFLSLIRAILPI